MSEINITPMIDVMLVLLIMLIMTLPPATHSIPIDFPIGAPTGMPPKADRLSIAADGTLAWNGVSIGENGVRQKLANAANDPRQPRHFTSKPTMRRATSALTKS